MKMLRSRRSRSSIIVALSVLVPDVVQAAKWAVIAAGSKGYTNYRHQADVCHAYQIMKKSGIPEENIILMMQDDVANSDQNMFKGKLFNHPGTAPRNVYDGCQVDYRGDVVTADLFKSVLTGDRSRLPKDGKFLNSTDQDEVFINFVDHGGVGIIAFPNGPLLHVTELADTLEAMGKRKMFKEMVFYLEACESGSMFPKLVSNGKILAVTAANGQESSWGTYCGDESKVNGSAMNTCLGDLFSVSWMEDFDSAVGSETLRDQIQRVTNRTNKSHVLSFGDTSIEDEPIQNFELRSQRETAEVLERLERLELQKSDSRLELPEHGKIGIASDVYDVDDDGTVNVRDIFVRQAYWIWQQAASANAKLDAWKYVEDALADRRQDENLFTAIAVNLCKDHSTSATRSGCRHYLLKTRSSLVDLECHKHLVDLVFHKCPRSKFHDSPGGWNGFNMRFSQVLVNACEGQHRILGKSFEEIQHVIEQQCASAVIARSGGSEFLI
eukprot:TRINITY_DN9709_c0_g5_i1.p1 TRINITY_DN9709_c0_g5~~TRINITY_DN9709_c0_g5_i1.p1  ORF type:complete len:497 (+),score=81.90 TRINITY_DN9709_c0_g5_i1:98-1588(+)